MKFHHQIQPNYYQHERSTQNSGSYFRKNYQQKINRKSRSRDNKRKRKYSNYSKSTSKRPSVNSFSNEQKGHYQFHVGQVLDQIYQITKSLGQGTFGRVVQGKRNNKLYAIKIIRPVDRYVRSAKIQKNIIKEINARDKQDVQGIVRYIHSFYHNSHYCLVFKPLGKSLYELLKINQFKGFPLKLVQSFFKQILHSIGFLHKIGYTHTDLKPENILLQSDDLYKIEGFTQQIYLPKKDKVRIIDFGGATKHNEFHSTVICTRQYRPPQVILQCCKWNQLADVWSIGCIISQLYTGTLLFSTHGDVEHLLMMQKNSPTRFPSWMIKKSKQQFQKLFQNGMISQRQADRHLQNWRGINNLKTIQQLFKGQQQLIDLLRKCLEIDPNKRINCKTALMHNFFSVQYN